MRGGPVVRPFSATMAFRDCRASRRGGAWWSGGRCFSSWRAGRLSGGAQCFGGIHCAMNGTKPRNGSMLVHGAAFRNMGTNCLTFPRSWSGSKGFWKNSIAADWLSGKPGFGSSSIG